MTEKTTTPGAETARKSRLASPYVMIWVALTAISILYLALLATNPTMVASALGAKTADHDQQQANAIISTELERLQSEIARLSSEIQAVRTDVSTGADRERELLERVAALEAPQTGADAQKVAALSPQAQKQAAAAAAKAQKVGGQLSATTPQPAAGLTVAQVPPKAAAAPKKQLAPAAVPGAPAAQATAQAQAAPGDQLGLETGSVGLDGVNFGTATVTPAQGAPQQVAAAAPTATPPQPKSVGIQIASGPSVQSLRLSWTLLSERHGASLSRYQPRYTVGATEQGVTYDLVVGPFANANDARQVCAELAASATPCSLQPFRGDAL